ncbi:MAG: hypothetical protein HY736_20265 [Verrucomicrobia bacterium]|nr:hypothetical protein [Verrucomicrobiota bacterium]
MNFFPTPSTRVAAAIRTAWSAPRLPWGMVAVGVAALVLRKPWALHTPQLSAEDGTIFLTQDDQMGVRALVEPYMGYLHLLPRLIAWFASHTADPAWWPAIYNGATLLVTAALFVRLASPRLQLPGKPWLLLAFAFVPHTGEVFFNITNLQWITAFFLLQQVLIGRPTSHLQRGVDLALIAVVGLTGPFAAVFLPLFAWRWWRDRDPDTLAALLVATTCAGIQAWFLIQTGPRFEHQAQPLHAEMFFAVLGSRFVLWPLLGPTVTGALTLPVLGATGVAGFAALAIWALRPHARRGLRAQILAAFALLTTAGVLRLRPDTWDAVNLLSGDRYFYVPRVLLAWLLIWECDAIPRAVAFAARGLGLTAVLAQVPHYKIHDPPDYRWAEHCDPIRRGEPANIYTLPEGWWIEYPGRPARK